MKRATLVLALLLGGVGQARAEFIITISQDGANVDAKGKGSINTTALAFLGGPTTVDVKVSARDALVITGPVPPPLTIAYSNFSGPTSFGTGGQFLATTGDGDQVGVAMSGLGAPPP